MLRRHRARHEREYSRPGMRGRVNGISVALVGQHLRYPRLDGDE